MTSAGPTTDTLPILAPPNLAGREHLMVRVGEELRQVVPVADVAGLPGLQRRGTWVLVPRQALASPGPADESMISGPGADPEELRAAVEDAVDGGGDLTVTKLAQVRDKIEKTGFNNARTLLLRIGVVGAARASSVLLVPCSPRGRVTPIAH